MISIGLAGALSPHLKVGDVVIADQIITGAGELGLPRSLAGARWLSRLPHAHQGQFFGSDVIIGSADTKSGLYDTHRRAGGGHGNPGRGPLRRRRNLPLAALRVISDDASHVLPPAALVAMKPDGGIALGRVLGSLLRKPLQVPALIRTARARTRRLRNYSAAAISVVSDLPARISDILCST